MTRHLDPTNLPPVLTPADVAKLFRVDAKTVGRWANRGLLSYFRTPGRHLRFHRADVLALYRRAEGGGQ